MNNLVLNSKYPLEERTAKFGEDIIRFCSGLSLNTITQPVVNQLIRSGTGIGANYMEANGGSSRKDFQNKIYICKKETQETKHWLRMMKVCFPERLDTIEKLWAEAQELTLIFSKIVSTLKNGKELVKTSN
ncbi:MAG: hypothetical protein A2660_01335 [Candidatus Doudnabacteria bacterium RIFCSPHIGHO2_01_FULL_45_18]|uniref:Four helix bundle protein n=1 Tax=Candidatus Doudnabacteria bacterium RIFCSPHIGHO2_01_FULL_45_18 TaxID=1817823 RepID=A0A1F5NS37_9BACT|nr:MAG: hypothetical protein A2660_01335 [Candidatus Doudnabacteria bacterium RIFCSPHIGHO2_01_FULL_45_18]